jgi:hypothetical protein
MKVLIATPAYGGVVHTTYHHSIFKTLDFFAQEFPGIRFETKIMSISLLAAARNVLASTVLNDPSYSHLLFIDADMGFAPSLIAKMLAFRKPVVGIVAPAKSLDLEAYYRARAGCGDVLAARLVANDYVAGDGALIGKKHADGTKEIDIVDGFVQVHHTGTGIMLIERGALEAMRDRFPDLWIADPPAHVRKLSLPTGGYFQCFEPMRDDHCIALGEDVSFCLRWVNECQGEIWANIDEAIVHVGNEVFAGQYLNKLQVTSKLKLNIRNSSPGPTTIAAEPAKPANRHERRALRHAR